MVFAVNLHWFPIEGAYDPAITPSWSWEYIASLLRYAELPLAAIVLCSLAGWMLGMRNMMVTTISEDFVLMAVAKGLPRRRVMWHAARNAVIPSIANLALTIGLLGSGSLVVEQVFNYPGVGNLLVQAVSNEDYPLIQGVFLVVTFTVLIFSLAGDAMYYVLDPRTRSATVNVMGRFRLPRSPKVVAGIVLLAFFGLMTIIGPWIAPYDPNDTTFTPDQAPSWSHLLGTTTLGQDVISQLLVGCRVTIVASFIAGLVATLIAVVIGLAAGYVGGKTDEGLSMLSTVFVIPGLPLLIVISSYLPPGQQANPIVIGVVIAVTGWAWGARVLRAQTLSLRNRDFVEASRIIGESRWRIMFSEIGPNLLPDPRPRRCSYDSRLHRRLHDLGLLGSDQRLHVELGAMLDWAQNDNAALANEWWWIGPPGIAIALVGTGLALINFGIDEFINPRLRSGALTTRQRRRAGLGRRPRLGYTPVVRTTNSQVKGQS
jgi:peptide/nickel transport system permease protein